MEASGAASAPPAQGSPTPTSQPPASGQGQGQGQSATGGQSGQGFNWGMFPNIPEGHRELLEPHLREIQGYTTRLEQQVAPYRSLMGAIPEDQVQNMIGFLNQWGADPVSTWLGLAQSLKDDGIISNPAFSVEQIAPLIQAQQQMSPGAGVGGEEVPQWAQALQARIDQMEQQENQRVAQVEEQQQQQMLGEAQVNMRATLAAAGLPEELLSQELLNSAIIAQNGDVAAATTMLTNMRESILKGFTESNGSGPKPPTMVGGAPQAPQGNLRPRQGDPFRQATVAAEQALAMSNRAEAQG